MNFWQRWVQAPQTSWLRKLLFQLHLWLGISLGLYVLLISLSGSALLLKSPFYTLFEPKNIEALAVPPLEGDALAARMAEVYAGYEIGFTFPSYEPNRATYVVLNRDGAYFPHYFNQYTGEDMGAANPWPIRAVEKLADVHDDLLLGRTGRRINGLGGLMFLLMSCSGLVIWWQGRARWYEGLLIRRGSRRGVLWQLHSFTGFWALLLMVAWGVSGFQLGFPQYLGALVDWLDTDLTDFERPDAWLRFFRSVHFARPGEGPWLRWAWILASFLPTLMFVSGFLLWWKRVVRKQKVKELKP
jgi:uncharacterized iron-regulated membrane protein